MFGQTAPKNRVPETFILPPNGRMPNSHLPVVFYRDVAPAREDLEPYLRRLFNHNHWGGDWAMGIYGYHHFHSNAHEVLGIAAGSATLVLGGDGGRLLEVTRGDVCPQARVTVGSKTAGIFGLSGRIPEAKRTTTSSPTTRCAPIVSSGFAGLRCHNRIQSLGRMGNCRDCGVKSA